MAKLLKIPYESTEMISVGIVADTDPTAFAVLFALGTSVDISPDTPEFKPASWKPNGPFVLEVSDKYQKANVAKIMASSSSGSGLLKWSAEGDYYLWVKFTDGIQSVIRNAGKIRVT